MRRGRVVLKSPREIDVMRRANQHTAEVLALLCEAALPGVSTWDLDQLAREQIARRGVKSAFLGYRGYPAVICASVNEQIVHGIPRRDKVLADGDIISLDFGVVVDGFVGDTARTVPVGNVAAQSLELIALTEAALAAAIEVCTPSHRLSDIGRVVQGMVHRAGYGLVRDFVGHGIGTAMHEDPAVPNFYGGPLPRLRPGLVIAVEPMVNLGSGQVRMLDDGWTAVTADGCRSAHFEHSIAIGAHGPVVLSQL